MTQDARSKLQQQYLQAMGIPVWERRGVDVIPEAVASPVPQESAPPQVVNDDVASLDWDGLGQGVSQCSLCPLHETRTQAVLGTGNRQADWLFIGEAPGAEEDRQGEPFVGRAGQLLNAMLQAMGMSREEVYIANILKCRPPGNRDPRPEEVNHCEPYLQRQIALIQPKVIVALGRIAAQNLLKTDSSLSKLRGKVYHYGEYQIPLVVTYHPAYLLRNLPDKRKAWQDLCFAMGVYKESQSTAE
jgi:DNA polymerase